MLFNVHITEAHRVCPCNRLMRRGYAHFVIKRTPVTVVCKPAAQKRYLYSVYVIGLVFIRPIKLYCHIHRLPGIQRGNIRHLSAASVRKLQPVFKLCSRCQRRNRQNRQNHYQTYRHAYPFLHCLSSFLFISPVLFRSPSYAPADI